MNQLTRCGLLPSVPECSSFVNFNVSKKSCVNFGDNIVVPAPFAFRPFAQYYNPYSRGCSVLCNHPVDEETKQQASLHNSKNLIESKYRIIIENEDCGNGNWQNDDIFVPEALFRRYTETDSRPPSPTTTSAITNLSPKILAAQSRRCVTPDPHLHVPEKTQLILDLRKTSSQTALNDNSLFVSSRDLLTSWSAEKTNKNDSNGKRSNLNQKNKSLSKTLVTDKNKPTKPMRTSKEIAKMSIKPLVKSSTSPPIITDLQEKKKKSVKRLKSKKKDTKRSSSAATKNGISNNLREPNETQISTLEEANGATKDNVTSATPDQEAVKNDTNEDHVEEDSNFYFTPSIEEHLIKRLRKEFNCEALSHDFDEKHLKIFEEIISKLASATQLYRFQDTSSDVDYEIKKLQREFRLNSIAPVADSFTNVVSVFSRRNSRFDLPMDRMSLEGLTPLQYLKAYVHIIKPRLWVYGRIFETYANNGEDFMKTQKLFSALVGIIGREFTIEEQKMCTDLFLLRTNNIIQIDFQTWCGISAFYERIFCTGHEFANFKDEPRDEVEIADFEFLDRKIRNLNISQQLKKILFMIRSS